MTPRPEQPYPDSQAAAFWQPDVIESFNDLCQSEGLNPVRLRRLIDRYITTRQKPSRQELIDALKQRPRIQERAMVLGSITKKLHVFTETFVDRLN
jgi:hypothetical protein